MGAQLILDASRRSMNAWQGFTGTLK